jgi:hypothetical protein
MDLPCSNWSFDENECNLGILPENCKGARCRSYVAVDAAKLKELMEDREEEVNDDDDWPPKYVPDEGRGSYRGRDASDDDWPPKTSPATVNPSRSTGDEDDMGANHERQDDAAQKGPRCNSCGMSMKGKTHQTSIGVVCEVCIDAFETCSECGIPTPAASDEEGEPLCPKCFEAKRKKESDEAKEIKRSKARSGAGAIGADAVKKMGTTKKKREFKPKKGKK